MLILLIHGVFVHQLHLVIVFVINDTYGDGICCSYGNGSYSVTYMVHCASKWRIVYFIETTTSIGGCVPVVIGCMNPNANNYNPNANTRLWHLRYY